MSDQYAGTTPEHPRVRRAVRVVMIDPDDRFLLMRFVEGGDTWWGTIGGGVESGETDLDAVRREVREETGLAEPQIGPCIWLRDHTFPFRGGWLRQVERIYVARTPAFDAVCADPETEGGCFGGLRWWTVPELDTTTDAISPTRLAELARGLLRDGPPPEPVDVGI